MFYIASTYVTFELVKCILNLQCILDVQCIFDLQCMLNLQGILKYKCSCTSNLLEACFKCSKKDAKKYIQFLRLFLIVFLQLYALFYITLLNSVYKTLFLFIIY